MRSGFVYLLRHIFVTALNLVSNLVLLRLLPLDDFGAIAILNILIALVTLFSDGGLCAYLVQRDRDIEADEINRFVVIQGIVYFAIHILVGLALCVGLLVHTDINILKYCAVVLFVVPLLICRGGCFVVLERDMRITQIAVLESVESLVYSVFCIGFAYSGFGVWSVVFALFIKAVVGFFLSIRRVSIRYKWIRPEFTDEVFAGIKYGIYFHLPTLLSQARGIANPLIVGGLIGIWAVGVCDRSAFIAGLPLFFVGAVQSKVLFPYFSKLRRGGERSEGIFYRSLYLSSVLDKILFLPLFLIGPAGILLVIGDKWASAIPVIYLMAIGNAVFGAYSASISVYLYGLGRAHVVGRLSAICTLITWLAIYPALHYFGVLGYAVISLLNWLPGLLFYFSFKSDLSVLSILRGALLPLVAFVVTWLLFYLVDGFFVLNHVSFPWLILISLLGICVYCFVLMLLDYKRFRIEASGIIKVFI